MLFCSLFKEFPLIVEVVGPVAMLQRGEGRAAPGQTGGDKGSDGCQGDQNPAQHLRIIFKKKNRISIHQIFYEQPIIKEISIEN